MRNTAANQIGTNVVDVQPNAGSNARCCPEHADIKSKIIRWVRMPLLPKEEAQITVRPRGGLCISKVGPTAIADAILQTAGLDSATQDTDTMCPNFQRNIMADLVRPKPDANTGAAPAPRNDPPPEQAVDAEVIRLRKENEDLKNTINRLVNEMAEIKKLVSNASGKIAAVRASETPISAPVDEVSEVKQTLTALADRLKQVAPSSQFLTDSVHQIQVALGDPKRGLGALADRIDAIEARIASPATVVQPLLREVRLKYPINAPTEGPILCAALTAPLGGSPSVSPVIDN
ncbi:hypothetical protein HPB49_017704 [Dermacentor silvarum]|uniref:Uncharacterized protein n=1 Tax=Dermacentor silvarum TaxID=543639 RepID=A0ACB8CYZ2_DERSI|nr:hypothetical protein HPB49_017704 [Dermacentor silvarum]